MPNNCFKGYINAPKDKTNKNTIMNQQTMQKLPQQRQNPCVCTGNDNTQSCGNLKHAFDGVGTAFAQFCEDIKNEIESTTCKPACIPGLSTGPLFKDLNMKSIIAMATNWNEFPVKVKMIVNHTNIDVTPYFCETITIQPRSGVHFSIVDTMNFDFISYIVSFLFLTEDDQPVCGKVEVFAAGRSDLPQTPLSNSALLDDSTFNHARFKPIGDDPLCSFLCPCQHPHPHPHPHHNRPTVC